MGKAVQLDLSSLSGEHCVFWSAGNNPTQKLYGLSSQEIGLHLKSIYLLSDKVLAAASFYFESPSTRAVTRDLDLLFQRGEILYFVESSIENFTEHGAKKAEKSPPELVCYHDREIVTKRAATLDSLGHILRRPSYSLSEQIVELWMQDVYSKEAGSLGEILDRLYKDQNKSISVELQINQIAKNRSGEDFVWEYLQPRLKSLELPVAFLSVARMKLSQAYAVATSKLLGVPIDLKSSNLLNPFVTADAHYDSSLFLSCMDILGVKKYLQQLLATDLVKLKSSEEFVWFRSFYFALIESVDYQVGELRTWLPKYREASLSYSKSEIPRELFLNGFKALCETLNKHQGRYSRPLEVLLHIYDLIGRGTIEDFVVKIGLLSKKLISKRAISYESIRVVAPPAKLLHSGRTEVVKILFLAANPIVTERLSLDEEIREINAAFITSPFGESFELKQHWAVRVDELQQWLLRHDPHIVHFSGHGSADSEIILTTDTGEARPVKPAALGRLFNILKGNIRCVVLNACFTKTQAQAIARHIDCVVGMSKSIGDEAAVHFAAGFYRGLAHGKSVRTSFDLGCNDIDLAYLGEEETPKLLTKRGINASDVKFVHL